MFTPLLMPCTYTLIPRPGARPTGKFATEPMRNLDMEEIAAVEVVVDLADPDVVPRIGYTQVFLRENARPP